MLKNHFYTIVFISWMVLITLLSLFSFSGDGGPKIEIPHLDKLVHFTFYLIAAILGSFSIRERTKGRMGLLKTAIIIGVSVIVYGIIIEVIQDRFTIHRSGEIFDVLANSFGAFVGVIVIKLLFSGKRQLKWKI